MEQVPIAIDGIAFYVHPQVSIPGLSLSQIRDIFTGKITNWKEVEGQDLPIVPWVHSSQASGIADFIEENVLVGEKLASSVQAARTPTESLRRVANIPGAIGYATASIVVGQNSVRLLPIGEEAGQAFVPPFAPNAPATVNESAFANGSYPLTRRLFIVIKRDGRLDEQAGIVYTNLLLSDEGQRLIEQAGFVPIR